MERKLASLGARSHGVVTRAGLLAAGISSAELEHRLKTGALIREHHGVYSVGHRATTVEARYLAAVVACGERALLSGRAAAWLWGLVRGQVAPPEVTAPTYRRVRGIRTRRCRFLEREATTWRGVPITTPARTLVDLAAVLSPAQLARAAHEAGVSYRTTPAQVEAVLARRGTQPCLGAGSAPRA